MCVPFPDRCCSVAQAGHDLPVLLALLVEGWDFKAYLVGLFVAKQLKPVATTLTLALAHLCDPYSNFASCSKSEFFVSFFSCP